MSLGRSLFDGRINWKRWLPLFLALDVLALGLILGLICYFEAQFAEAEPQPATSFTLITPTPTSPAAPTPTGTAVVPPATQVAPTTPARLAGLAYLQTLARRQIQKVSFKPNTPLVLAHYFAWYDGDGWSDCNISGGDKPLQPYHSDDPAAMARHIDMARSLGLDGFTLHWFAPGDRTDRNFRTLLAESQGSNFASTVVFSYHIWHGLTAPSQQNIGQALRYIIEQHAPQPNFLRIDDRPVIFFTDVYRAPGNPQAFWAAARDEVDPERQTLWIAEGLDPSYLNVFDGLYVFKISHAAYPRDYLKSPRWGRQVRQWADQTGQPKLWIATISPGWDDLRSICQPDVRVANTPHRLERAEGAVYEATFQAALDSRPDWLIVSSFNEWVEGSYIEPSEQYGQRYMELTAEFVRRFKDQ